LDCVKSALARETGVKNSPEINGYKDRYVSAASIDRLGVRVSPIRATPTSASPSEIRARIWPRDTRVISLGCQSGPNPRL
jgi:hypothetical protein